MTAKFRWSDESDRVLVRLVPVPDLLIKDIAKKMKLSRNQVLRRMKTLDLERGRVGEWSEDEIAFLRSNLTVKGFVHCAAALGRSREAINVQSRRLGLDNPSPRSDYWQASEDRVVLANRVSGQTYAQTSAETGRTPEAVRYRYGVLKKAGQAAEDEKGPR